MSSNTRNHRFSRLAAAVVGAIGLAALALPLAPAQAQVYFGCGPLGCGAGVGPFLGPLGIGIGNPYFAPYYPPYAYPYYDPWYPEVSLPAQG